MSYDGAENAENAMNLPATQESPELSQLDIATPEWIDGLELAMLSSGQLIDLPLIHRFTPGLYIREILLPAGTVATTKIHKTEHPYAILRGKASVFIHGVGAEVIEVGHVGITKPGTRRVIYAHEDTVWITFHTNPDNGQDLAAIEERLIERRELTEGKSAFELYREEMELIYLIRAGVDGTLIEILNSGNGGVV